MNFLEAALKAKQESRWFRLTTWRGFCYAFGWVGDELVITTNDNWKFISITGKDLEGIWEVIDPFDCETFGAAILMEDL